MALEWTVSMLMQSDDETLRRNGVSAYKRILKLMRADKQGSGCIFNHDHAEQPEQCEVHN